MTSPSASRTTSASWKPASLPCVLVVILMLTVSLTSCASVSSAPRASLEIYQPRVLRLKAGQEVPTVDGRYRPQVDETWHSAAAFNQLEKENINLAAALAQERARR